MSHHSIVSRIAAGVLTRQKTSRIFLALFLSAMALWLLFRVLSPANAGPAQTSAEHPIAMQAQPATLASANAPSFTERRFLPTNPYVSQSIAVGDMDGNGDLDIVVGRGAGYSSIYLNDGKGNYNATRSFGSWFDTASSMAVADMDNDGTLDIIVGNGSWSTGRQNVVYRNDGSGHYNWVNYFGTGADKTTSIAVGDVDGDGNFDIVVGNYGQPSVVYLNDGIAGFYSGPVNCAAPPANVRCFGTGADEIHNVSLGDVNGDGALDIVVGNLDAQSGVGQQNVVYLNGV